ncbi:helix-turn-helix domain-containing protein [Halolamina sp.]|uniref:helix-turn-helix domain-containing protein n=1 Tax=Halolamina sp. TaxID=1940283 RepID=UPI00067758B1
MTTIVKATVSTGEFALRDTFAEIPAATFETLGVAAHNTSQPIPLLRATAPELDALDAAIRRDATVDTVQAISSTDDQRLYDIRWAPRIRSLLGVLVETGGALLEASAHEREWEFNLLFSDHQKASRTYHCCQDCGIDLTVSRLKNDPASVGKPKGFLSDTQQETLVTAYETDYYTVPRGVTMEELADRLGISHQALSERLRRGHQGLISKTLSDDSDTVELL